MHTSFHVSVTREGSMARIVVSGELDIATAPALLEHVRGAAEGASSLVLDLRAVTFIDSTGLRALLTTDDELRGRLRLIQSASPSCVRLFEITGVSDRLPFVAPDQPG